MGKNINQILKTIKVENLVLIIEQGIKLEKLNLEAHKTLGDEQAVLRIRHRIADARLLSLFLTGDLR